ncbi:cupin [Agrococcus sp. ARC_14]|uniref:cupin n=1 Tax=Agrococcus sp. ARC_14 TaxID=2919927 RepID=UPI001F0649D1|nr:cupin [Agrococcus sp. ARC_14]MCH1881702.1 cupin [Agrococcus sp. ARC_14]
MATPKLLADDDRFRIIEWTIEPGDAIELHTHEHDYAVIGIEASTMWAVLPDGSELEVPIVPGEGYTRRAGATHRMENRGDVRVVFTEVEAKASTAP